ncbi:BCS1 N terminal-domain-containing protein [Phlyctochytrium arcticum]|nr:BCS1 N terminal-domain-containing protein [Phlyctochytrium arcticum]
MNLGRLKTLAVQHSKLFSKQVFKPVALRSPRMATFSNLVGWPNTSLQRLSTLALASAIVSPSRSFNSTPRNHEEFPELGVVNSKNPPSEQPSAITTLIQMFTSQAGLESNPVATGGITLAVMGALVAGAGIIGNLIWEGIKRYIVVTAEFDNKDEAYNWILAYMADHPLSKNTTRFSVTTNVRQNHRRDDDELGLTSPPVYFLPSPGTHFFTFNSRILMLSRTRSSKGGEGDGMSSANKERITISTLGWSRTVLESLVYEAQRLYIAKDKQRTIIYSADQYGNWTRIRSRPIRAMSTIVLDQGIKELVISDVKEFLASETWYADRGIPYRRGYMFYGKPGTGKTSFVTSLAGEFKLNIYVISLANKGMTDETLTELMVQTPARCILLLEDIDAAFVSRVNQSPPDSPKQRDTWGMKPSAAAAVTTAPNTISTNVTFSGLLNAIDGVAAQEGRIVCMTTNHLNKLDPALVRPGRVDVKLELGLASREQIRQLFSGFFPGHAIGEPTPEASGEETMPHTAGDSPVQDLHPLATQFAEAIPPYTISIAQIQGFLMRFKHEPVEAVKNVEQWLKEERNGSEKDAEEETEKEVEKETEAEGVKDIPAVKET